VTPPAGVLGKDEPGLPARARPLGAQDPQTVGPYRLEGLLGRGGMGSVYLARTVAGRYVAVKVVRAEFAAEPEFGRLFHREAELAQRVARFCTAEVIEVGTDGDRPYLVTEFVDGPTLTDEIRASGRLYGASLERVAIAVATALTAIHDAGTVHRDLKPSNVLLSSHGPLVIDFGIALALDGTTQVSRQSSGTPAFMAPEQARGRRVGKAADIFAWGGIVVFAATGRPPFGTGPSEALLYRVVHEQPNLDGVPEPLRTTVAGAMNKDPERRPTASALYQRLLASAPAAHTTESTPATHASAAVFPRSEPALGSHPLDTPAPVLAPPTNGQPNNEAARWPADSPTTTGSSDHEPAAAGAQTATIQPADRPLGHSSDPLDPTAQQPWTARPDPGDQSIDSPHPTAPTQPAQPAASGTTNRLTDRTLEAEATSNARGRRRRERDMAQAPHQGNGRRAADHRRGRSILITVALLAAVSGLIAAFMLIPGSRGKAIGTSTVQTTARTTPRPTGPSAIALPSGTPASATATNAPPTTGPPDYHTTTATRTTVQTAPGPVRDLQIQQGEYCPPAEFTVSWNPPAAGPTLVTSYTVTPGQDGLPSFQTTNTTFTYPTLDDGTVITVRANSAAGPGPSASTVVRIQHAPCPTTTGSQSPALPG
jgi:serine/threonine protein kinase